MTYDILAKHFSHPLEIAMYGEGDNLAIECVKCYDVIIDFDRKEY